LRISASIVVLSIDFGVIRFQLLQAEPIKRATTANAISDFFMLLLLFVS
jgi:hypothetical protein